MNLISDAVRFALYNRYTIENAPLQAYVSALIFSPINSLIREEFGKEGPIWVNLEPIIETSWSLCMQTLEGHSFPVHSVAFSPDGRQIISGSSDRTVKIWDRESGACTQTLEGHDVSDVVAVEKSNMSYLHVLTNRGWINLAASQELSDLSMGSDANSRYTTDGEDNEHGHEHGYRYGYSLSADCRWVCRHEQSVLWLPPDYRPMSSAVRCFPSHAATTSDRLVESTVALGCRSGRVIILGLADRLP